MKKHPNTKRNHINWTATVNSHLWNTNIATFSNNVLNSGIRQHSAKGQWSGWCSICLSFRDQQYKYVKNVKNVKLIAFATNDLVFC